MLNLKSLADLAGRYPGDLDHAVAPLRIGERVIDSDREPVLMGVVNLSRDSAYRESVAVDPAAAVRMARTQFAQGAAVIDIGAEASQASAALVTPEVQLRSLLPVIETLAADQIPVSVESYSPQVVKAALGAGARVLNLTGSDRDEDMFALAAEHNATLVLCHVLGPHARALDGSDVEQDPVPAMLDSFGARIDRAREHGVTDIAIDPGLGFSYRLDDQRARIQYQAAALLHSVRLRRLGVPVCHALPHAFELFGDQFRSGEGFFAVLASLGGTGVYRTHEVSLTRSVLEAMGMLTTDA